MVNIGWIGLGKMGIPMSGQFEKAGYSLAVYNRSPNKALSLVADKIKLTTSPKALLDISDVVFIMVTDDKAVRDVFLGVDGLLEGECQGKTFINMSTISPGISKELNQLCQNKHAQYIDAPVSGSVKQAEDAQLVIMAGSTAEIFETVKPLLNVLGKLVLHVGPVGAGNTTKLAINTMLAIQAQALSEAILFARNNDIQTVDLLTLLGAGALGNGFIKFKGEAILKDNFEPAFTLKNIVKDLRLAKSEGFETPLSKTVLNTFESAEQPYGDLDMIAIIKAIQNG